jgi:predicted transcriptional regulator
MPKARIHHLTTKIVGNYLRHHTVGASELPNLITSVIER